MGTHTYLYTVAITTNRCSTSFFTHEKALKIIIFSIFGLGGDNNITGGSTQANFLIYYVGIESIRRFLSTAERRIPTQFIFFEITSITVRRSFPL